MRPLLFVIILLCCCGIVWSQTGTLTGTVIDSESKAPLELATVSIFGKDSALITYQLSDKAGKFTLGKLPLNKSMNLSITYTGYTGYHTSVHLEKEKGDSLVVLMIPSLSDTGGIVITTTVPIRMNGDTLEINPAAFKMNTAAVVEELLAQVAGVTIWSDGTITVNGKKVQNLLVDGKSFLGSTDPRIATQNLPKTAIDKIQVYQEYDRSQIGQQNKPQDSLFTMNIKLKEASKKGYFGKAGAGYGTADRFESDLSVQVYNKRSSAGIAGGYNNINKSIGNLQEMLKNNTYRNSNPNLYNVGRFGINGINKNYSVGSVLTHSFIETSNSRVSNRIIINYNTSGMDTYITNLTLQNRTVVNNAQFSREEGVQNNRNHRHDLSIDYAKTNSYDDNLNLNGNMNSNNERVQASRFTQVSDSANMLQSTNAIITQQSRQSQNTSLNFRLAKSGKNNSLKNYNVQFNVRANNSTSQKAVRSIFESLLDNSKNTAYNRRYDYNNELINITGSLDYAGLKRLLLGRYNLFGVTLNFMQGFNYNRSLDETKVADYDSTAKRYVVNSYLSNDNWREIMEYNPALRFSKVFSKWGSSYTRIINTQVTFFNEIKSEKNRSSFTKRNLDRSFQFFRYEGNINYFYQKRQVYQYSIYINYTKNFEYPAIDQLYTIVDDINAYEIRIGNPNLQNRINHRLDLNASLNTEKPRSPFVFSANINCVLNRALHPISDSVRNDLSGKRILYYVNADKSSGASVSYDLNLSRRFNKNSLQLIYNGQWNNNHISNYIDGLYNISEYNNLTNGATFQFMLRSMLILNIGQVFQRYSSEQTADGLRSFGNFNNSTRFGITVNYPANFTFSSTGDYTNNSALVRNTLLWNVFATCRLLKQQGELKLSAMDLLKQYQNVTPSASAYGTSTRITNGLQRYFLLTFSYYPRKFGKTETKKRSD